MKIIAGLGNPGKEYVGTPHNIGFDVTEQLAAKNGGSWKETRQWKMRSARVTVGGEQILIVQPLTFMNLSGESIAPVMRYYSVGQESLLVVSDDADLPLGRIRFRPNGGAGGHRGLASVIAQTGSEGFARLRLGVGRAENRDLKGFVLDRFPADAAESVRQLVATAVEAAEVWVSNGINEAMNRFNAAPPQTESEKAT